MSSRGSSRSLEDVMETARVAGVSGTCGPVQVLGFSEHLNSQEARLFELPKELMTALQAGDTVVLRGERDDDVVVCTENKTFELKKAETSNVLLLSPSLTVPAQKGIPLAGTSTVLHTEVCACESSYFEARPCRPRIDRLKRLLRESPYLGPEYEGNTNNSRELIKPNKFTLDQLLDAVQASEQELNDALRQLHACMIDGFWRLLDADYEEQSFQHILSLLEEKDWPLHHVPLEECANQLEELQPRFITDHCLQTYGFVKSQDPEVVYGLSEERVCQHYAQLLLRPVGQFNYEEFMECWRQSVPDGVTTSTEYLRGLALWDLNSTPHTIRYYSSHQLADDPTERFAELFKIRERWVLEDLLPYIRNLEMPTQSLNALLLRYTRASTNQNGQKVYNAKLAIR